MPVLANSRHEIFAQEVAKGTPLDTAYALAGYNRRRQNASRLMTKEIIRARIDELLSIAAEKSGVTIQRVITELAKIAFSDIRKAIRWKSARVTEEDNPEGGDLLIVKTIVTNLVELIGSDEIDDDTAGAISEISQNTTGGVKVKFHDKRAALIDLGKHLGLFEEKGDDGKNTININVRGGLSDIS